jgi:hypothetical protein
MISSVIASSAIADKVLRMLVAPVVDRRWLPKHPVY